ncbi:GNAT family N-acetyltransferase [Desulfovibrio sp. OttesenSCG-928-M16]|nr:GNAT family N-acetyltransferase [Desulfovibrio sp. OttesenSCG-928-M16]
MRIGESGIICLGEKDAAELAALEAKLFALPFGEDSYRRLLAAAQSARARGEIAPFQVLALRGKDAALEAYVSIILHLAAREVEICNIATVPALRRRGLAGALLDHVLELALSLHLERAVLEVRESNAGARALYHSRNFSCCGRRKAYYSDTGEDALVLECALAQHHSPPILP